MSNKYQEWLLGLVAAPVFFVDQGLLREGAVDVERDLPRGIEVWLNTVAAHGVGVVLLTRSIRLQDGVYLKRSSGDREGYLSWKQIERIEKHARSLKISVLWAGGLKLRDAYEMGRLNVFGIYVTSAAATTIPVHGSYVRDPALVGAKKPTKEAVLRTKILLEAGFLASKLQTPTGEDIGRIADTLLSALDQADVASIKVHTVTLASKCAEGWRTYWKAAREDPS